MGPHFECLWCWEGWPCWAECEQTNDHLGSASEFLAGGVLRAENSRIQFETALRVSSGKVGASREFSGLTQLLAWPSFAALFQETAFPPQFLVSFRGQFSRAPF